jgi:S-adenosylmethionine:tRNA ribosyltransferase-isomerase
MDVREFDFELPRELIAQEPCLDRDGARLLLLDRVHDRLCHSHVSALPDLLHPGDLLVVNNTRVFPARLLGRRVPSGGAVECLLTARAPRESEPDAAVAASEGAETRSGSGLWEALTHPGQKLKPGARVIFEGPVVLHAEILERRFHGRRLLRLWTDDGSSVDRAVDLIGHVPLPPYIRREDQPADRERYQTVFAARRGSVAAPTAGLHFSETLVRALGDRGIPIVEITLHVGYGTFQPVRVEQVEDHRLESEPYHIDPEAAEAINGARGAGRRVIAVGTTTTRTLEAVARRHGGRVVAGAGTTDLFIFPGHRFQVVDGLLTNFHLPRSSLLMLVSALAGRERVLGAYRAALAERYRFYSYGDCMLVL